MKIRTVVLSLAVMAFVPAAYAQTPPVAPATVPATTSAPVPESTLHADHEKRMARRDEHRKLHDDHLKRVHKRDEHLNHEKRVERRDKDKGITPPTPVATPPAAR